MNTFIDILEVIFFLHFLEHYPIQTFFVIQLMTHWKKMMLMVDQHQIITHC